MEGHWVEFGAVIALIGGFIIFYLILIVRGNRCPKCGQRMEVSTRDLGEEDGTRYWQTVEHCRNCGYHKEENRNARTVRSIKDEW